MPTYDWKTLLAQWSNDILSTELERAFPPEVKASGWIGYPGAAVAEIIQTEARLKTKLPPSYREFLKVTNGWRMVVPFLGRFWSTKEVEWLVVRRSYLIENWLMGEKWGGPPVSDEEYFVYGSEQDSILMRAEYLRSALEISDLDAREGAIYLLNPQVITPEGEWEAWYLASWLPGAARYRSFWEMMQAEYKRFVDTPGSGKDWRQEFIEDARKRLLPRDLKTLAAKLPDLIETLQHEIEIRHSLIKSEPGRLLSLPQFQQDVAESLQFATVRVREIIAQTYDPQDLPKQLNALADELDNLGRQGIQAAMNDFDWGQILLAGMMDKLIGTGDRLDRQFQSSGKPAGYQAAAGIIRSFLDE